MKRYALALLLLGACGGPDTPDDKPKETTTKTEVPSLDDSKCLGNRVPPTNYMQETAFVPLTEPDALETAKRRAIETLRDRHCQGYRCSELEPRITLWNTQQDAVQVCAMAVVKATDVDAFIAAPRAEFDQKMLFTAKEIEGTLSAAKKKRVAIDNVRDLGIDGGPRAEWLVDQIVRSLSQTQVELVRLPKGWDGLNLPTGVDSVLRGRVTRLHGRESMLDVTWTLDLGETFRAIAPVTFPEMIGPVVETSDDADLPDLNEKVSLRFDARPGGALCNGQTTEMKLNTTEPVHARVLDLYGNDEALLIWASEGATKPGKPSSLGEFMAVHQKGTAAVERFIVVAAKKQADLGAYAAAPIPCRIPKADAKKLHAGQGIPDAAKPYVTTRSYRIMEGEDCREFATPPDAVLDGIPMCW